MSFSDSVNREGGYAVITGGNRGIGWYTVKGLVNSGMKVIVGMLRQCSILSWLYD